MTKAQQLTEDNAQRVLLQPHGKEVAFWIMQVPSELDHGYLYTTTIAVEDTFHTTVARNVSYATQYGEVDLQEAQEILKDYLVADERVVSESLLLQCSTPTYVYSYEEIPLGCTLKNAGSERVTVSTCVYDTCKEIDLDSAQMHTFSFVIPQHDAGTHSVAVRADGDATVREYVVFTVLSDAGVQITEPTVPTAVGFEESSDLSFVVSSQKEVYNVAGYFNSERLLTLDALDSSKKLTFVATGQQLYYAGGANVTLFFEDHHGQPYAVSKQYPIVVRDVPWHVILIRVLMKVF